MNVNKLAAEMFEILSYLNRHWLVLNAEAV